MLAKAGSDAQTVTQTGLVGMHGKGAEVLVGTRDLQGGGKDKYETTRKQLAERFEAIYTKTKSAVDARLVKLDTDVNQAFDDGASSAKTSFYLYLAKELIVYFTGGFVVEFFSKDNEYQAIFDAAARSSSPTWRSSSTKSRTSWKPASTRSSR